MDYLSGTVRRVKTAISHHPFLSILFALIFFFFLVNARYVDYPDEFVNLLAGRAILHFGFPYKDVWDHHLPGAWYLAAPLLLLSGGSFAMFRLLWSLGVFASFLYLAFWIKKKSLGLYRYFLIFFFLYPLASLYFWFHLYLADSLAVFFFSIVFWTLFANTVEPIKTKRSLYWASFFTFCMIFSSTTYVYMGIFLYAWILYLFFKSPFHTGHHAGSRNRQTIIRDLAILAIIVTLPYLVYGVILLITGTFKDFYFANFVYNTTLYISLPNYVRGPHFNPVKFAMTIIANFYDGYLPLLSKIKYFDLYLPIGTLAGLSTLTLLLLFLSRSWIIGILFFFILSFSTPRSNIQNYKETDYQSAMFIVLGLISTMFVLYLLEEVEKHQGIITDLKRAARFVIGVFLLFTVIFLTYNTYSKTFQLYTQKLPSIHNRGEASGFIDELTQKGDYYFVGPYEPNEEYFVKNAQFPGKYVSLLPQFRESDYIRKDFLSEFDRHPPKIVLFKQQASIFGTPALVFGKFFYDWMSDKYTALEKVPGVTVLRQPTGFDIRTDLFLRNENREELLQLLESKGYISR